jgi:hypothetical protein
VANKQDLTPKVPLLRELIRWHNQFGRMLKSNRDGTKLFGADDKEVRFISRSSPDSFHFKDRLEGIDDDLGYSVKVRADGSESSFRLHNPNGGWAFLTYAECDLVLGSNYYMIDDGYSSPGPRVRKVLFKANENMAHSYYNAFELGRSVIGDGIRTAIIYYKIPKQRFMELRDFANLDELVNAVKTERKRFSGSKR